MDFRPRWRVLVADDADGLRELLCLLLGLEDDFEVVGQARDGGEAVRLAELLQPDLVVLDIAMPVMDGLEALRRVRDVSPASRVAIFSAFGQHTYGLQTAEAGASAYIEKGIGVLDLVNRLREVCTAESTAD